VFALGGTFLEVVSPIRPETAAGRLLDRRGGDAGYMLMFQVANLTAARERAGSERVREVFEVMLDDMAEVHLHPADMRAAIVSLSQPNPPDSWRWGGPDWGARSAPLHITGATIAVAQPVSVVGRWQRILDAELKHLGIRVSTDEFERGLTEVILRADSPRHQPAPRDPIVIGGVRFVFEVVKGHTLSPFEPEDAQEG
jgi:hypothetical protein